MYQSKQEVFDIVAKHLLTQKAKCEDGEGMCFYRKGTLMCAFGALIPNEVYEPNMETIRAVKLVETDQRVRDLFADQLMDTNFSIFLQDLQDVHDMYTVEEWWARLQTLADHESLVFSGEQYV